MYQFTSVQFTHSVVSDSLRPHELQHARPPCSSPTPSSLRLTPIECVMPSSHLILCRPLLLLPPIPPSIRVFSNESTLVAKLLSDKRLVPRIQKEFIKLKDKQLNKKLGKIEQFEVDLRMVNKHMKNAQSDWSSGKCQLKPQ